MLNRFQIFGKNAETVAARALKKNGYRILEKNFKTREGEIDIIAMDGDALVFVEVKARASGTAGSPKEAVTWQKQKRISKAAQYYLKTQKAETARSRFDVVAITYSGASEPSIEIIRNAFECPV